MEVLSKELLKSLYLEGAGAYRPTKLVEVLPQNPKTFRLTAVEGKSARGDFWAKIGQIPCVFFKVQLRLHVMDFLFFSSIILRYIP
jgi:hypothetical protein